MKKIIYVLISLLIAIIVVSCINSCGEEKDVIDGETKYQVYYKNEEIVSNNEMFEGLVEMDPEYVAKKIKKLREAKIHECYFENIEGGKILNIRNDEIIAKLYFDIHEDGSVFYRKYTLEHIYEHRNYNVRPKGMQLHSMYNNDYAAEIIGDLIFKTYYNNDIMFVVIPFHIKCYFNIHENKTKFIMEI